MTETNGYGIGDRFVATLVARDFPRLRTLMADDVRFRLLVPRGPQTEAGAADTVARFVGWYGAVDELRLESSYVATVADRLVITYRLRLRDTGGWRVIEQHLVAAVDADDRLDAIDLLCTGFHSERVKEVAR